MIEHIAATSRRLLDAMRYRHHRYIFNEFNTDDRLTGLIGPRGTGKTTILLQYINEVVEDQGSCIYASLDNLYFSRNTLLDFVNELYDDYGIRYFFLDEIHKYDNWNQELKNLYDSYPDIKIVFSGSSSIDLVKGIYDLSRRGTLFHIAGMSFREYLLFNDIVDLPSITIDQIINDRSDIERKIASVKKLKGYFKDYLGKGYYPFSFEGIDFYNQKIQRIIEKTIYEDISNFYKLKTENLSNFKRILAYLATIPPGKLNRNNIAGKIGLDNKTVTNYLNILAETGLVELISENKPGSNLLKKTGKIYLDNPDLYFSIAEDVGFGAETGTLREIFFIKMVKNAGLRIHYSKKGDFNVGGTIFEIGGKNKTLKQIKCELDNAFLVKDDILYGGKYEIPLYVFGFLY
ncbi:MAG: AAA family ATPase [Kiritimatiellaeota bacterium]|nr:AAA family ATPase [Kiritimatiellota bacterium]